ncbi:MAG: M67 family metallopeptidase [Candidatus Heimdallarchaeota archaeon]|nr:M67 family metallopeptidase [Candidatus Heimdallarchaeota archaeon]
MRIQIPKSEIRKIKAHAEEAFPEECCGILIGRYEDNQANVSEARRMRNTNGGSKLNRYNIDPMELVRLEDELDDLGLLMLGIYHSHPDHPSRPSKYDLERAWPNLSYAVLSVESGQAVKLTSWRLDGDNSVFKEENILEI